jgi:pyruvate,water dikinase
MRWIEDSPFNPRFAFWTRANLTEVFPEPPSPLGWDMAWEGACLAGWRDCYVHRFGMGDDELDRHRAEAIGFFGGYAYLGAALFRVWAGRTPGMKPTAIDEAFFGDHPDVPPYVAEDWHANPATTERMGAWLQWATGDMNLDMLEEDRQESLRVQASRPDLRTSSDLHLYARALSMRPLLRRMSCNSTVINNASSVGPGILGQICAGIGRPEALMTLLGGIGGIDSAAPSFALWELSRSIRSSAALTSLFDAGVAGLDERLEAGTETSVVSFTRSFRAFLAEYGSRGTNEWDLVAPVWEVCPQAALAACERMRMAGDDAAPTARNAVSEAERERVQTEIRTLLAADAEALAGFELGLRAAATFIPARERAKTLLMRVLHEMRMAVVELGRRFHERGRLDQSSDIFLLFTDELEDLVCDALPRSRELTRERRAHRAWLAGLEPPFIINGPAPANTTWPRRHPRGGGTPLAPGETLAGIPGAPGVATGRARIVTSSVDPSALEPDEVLVAPATDPSWTPLFVPAAAVVVEVGAMLSHAVIVSRELGIPCVVSAIGATERIPDGALVRVDGSTGVVTLLELP